MSRGVCKFLHRKNLTPTISRLENFCVFLRSPLIYPSHDVVFRCFDWKIFRTAATANFLTFLTVKKLLCFNFAGVGEREREEEDTKYVCGWEKFKKCFATEFRAPHMHTKSAPSTSSRKEKLSFHWWLCMWLVKPKLNRNEIIWPKLKYFNLKHKERSFTRPVFAMQSRARARNFHLKKASKNAAKAFSRRTKFFSINLNISWAQICFLHSSKLLSQRRTTPNDSHLPLKTTRTIIKYCRQPFIVNRPSVRSRQPQLNYPSLHWVNDGLATGLILMLIFPLRFSPCQPNGKWG